MVDYATQNLKDASMSEKFVYLEHVTDALIEAYGSTLEEAFENAAKATINTMVEIQRVKPVRGIEFEIRGADLPELLYNWLEAILAEVDADQLLLCDFELQIEKKNEGFILCAKCRGQKFDPKIHEFKTAVKAPTYHEMTVEKTGSTYVLRFLLDL
jgi:SHS2 domain-containing protein